MTQQRKWISWSHEDTDFLRKHYGKRNVKWMAQQLGRTEAAVVAQAGKRKLRTKNQWRRWSEKELQFLKDNLATRSLNWIANKLGRSHASTKMRALKIDFDGKLQHRQRDTVTDEQKTYIQCDLLNGKDIYSISKQYNVSPAVVVHIAINNQRKPPPSRQWQERWSKGDML